MNSKRCRKDIISGLPESLLCHILSFLPTKESALTSLLSKKWRYLFALSPNLDFDDSAIYLRPTEQRGEIHRAFTEFVDRVLVSRENSAINKFSLKCGNGVSPISLSRWVSNALERGVSDLDLRENVDWHDYIPVNVFESKSLVNLRVECGGLVFHVGDVFLPKLKTLYLKWVSCGEGSDASLAKLVSGCHVLEELVMIDPHLFDFWNRSVSSNTLKRLTLTFPDYDNYPDNVAFDTPSLVYFDYSDYVAKKYGKVNFDSLVEAKIGLRMTRGPLFMDMVLNATDLFMRISNVQTLYLFSHSLDVLTLCCESIPVFNNLIHLTIKTHRELAWESLVALLKNSPKLETLVFEGLHHMKTFKCEDDDGCLCKSSEEIRRTCLSSSPVKVLKILKFNEISFYSEESEKQKQLEQVKYFLETMPNLEEMIVCYDTRLIDHDVKNQLERLAATTRGASSKCSLKLIVDNRREPIHPYSFVD